VLQFQWVGPAFSSGIFPLHNARGAAFLHMILPPRSWKSDGTAHFTIIGKVCMFICCAWPCPRRQEEWAVRLIFFD
jgi:hypothetical protein